MENKDPNESFEAEIQQARLEAEKAESKARKEAAKAEIAAVKDEKRARRAKGVRRLIPAKYLLIGFAVVVAVIAAFAVFMLPSIMHKLKPTEIVTESSLLQAIDSQDLSTYELVYNGIASKFKEDNSIDYSVAYDATVTATVPLDQVRFNIDTENKVVTVSIPEFQVEPHVAPETLDYLPDNPSDNLNEIVKLCEEDATNTALDDADILTPARISLESTIRALTLPLLNDDGYSMNFNTITESKTVVANDASTTDKDNGSSTDEQEATNEAK